MNPVEVKLSSVLKKSFITLFQPRVFVLFFLPFFFSLGLLIFGLWMSWEFWLGWATQGLKILDPAWPYVMQFIPAIIWPYLQAMTPILHLLFFVLLVGVSLPLVVVVNLILISILTSSYLVQTIAKSFYPELEKKGESGGLAGVWNTLSSSFLYLVAWFVLLPFWIVPGVQVLLPILLTAWLNRRICTFDALVEYATKDELHLLKEKTAGTGYILGLVTSGLNYIPLALLISPVVTMVAFIHLQLEALQLDRRQKS